jgi:hypothetical protein
MLEAEIAKERKSGFRARRPVGQRAVVSAKRMVSPFEKEVMNRREQEVGDRLTLARPGGEPEDLRVLGSRQAQFSVQGRIVPRLVDGEALEAVLQPGKRSSSVGCIRLLLLTYTRRRGLGAAPSR